MPKRMLGFFLSLLKNVPVLLILLFKLFFLRLQHQTADHSSFIVGGAFSKVDTRPTDGRQLNPIFPSITVGANITQNLPRRTTVNVFLGVIDTLVFAERPRWFFQRLPL